MVQATNRGMTHEVIPWQPEVLCNWRSFKSLVSPVISVTIHPHAELALGLPNILFSTLSTRYQVNHIHCSAVSTALQSYFCPIRRLGFVGRGYHVAGPTFWSATGLAFAMRLIICGIWLQSSSHKKVSEAFGPSEGHNWLLWKNGIQMV